MRGQEQDKVVPREGKSKAESENQEASGLSGASGAHQIRSRITVVCAECKRLKLKCDRRNPCGSCTKRDTVARCIYSTAAAEKVDLHSLNNRLMQVESILAMVTAGESPPPFQSSYPLAQVALNTPSSTRASQARFKAPLMSPLSISLEDLRSIWLMHGQNDLDGEDASTSVKLESIGMDNLLRLQDSDLDSTSDSPHTGPTTRARIKLPSLHAYYSQPTRATPHFRAQSAPVASETLFALLPSPPNRAKYICRAVNADPSLTLLANWDAVNQAARFPDKGGLPDLSWTASTSTTPREGVSIPAFAALTYVVAIGMLEGEGEEDTFSSDQLDDLGSQAVQVCEDYLLGENAGNEAYQANDVVDFVSAAVLRLRFKVLRLRHGSSSNTVPTNGLQALFPLIGHLVNLARTSGLTVETDDMPENISQARTLIWWEVCFYDAFISDALGQPSLILPTSFTTKLPELDLVDSQLGATSMIGDGTLKEAESSDHITSSKSRPSNNKSEFRCFCGSHGLKSGNAWRRLEDQGKGTLFVRCRITTLIQSLRQALSHYSCECNRGMGYTLDRATEVELLVRQFLDEVPPALKLHPQPRVEQSREPWMAILAAETSIMANRIIIATYVPLMRPPLDASTGEPSRARTYAAQPWSSPNRAILEASQTIITAAGALQSSKHMENPSHFLAFHPVLKAVFDATVICSHTGLGNGVGYSVSVAKVACDDATKGLDLIHTLGRLSPEMAQIVATLRQRVPADALSPVREGSITLGQQSLKRKRTRAASPALSSDLDLELSPPNDSLAIPSTPALSSTPGGTDSDHPGTSDQRVSRSSTEMAPERPKQEAHKYPPAVGIRNRGKGGPAWAKKPSSRQPTSAYPEHTLIPDPLGLSIPSRPVSSLSGTLESVASPHGSDSFMGTFSRSGLNPPLLANDPSSHAYRPSSAHPQSDLELDERYRQRRRLSYDEAATSSMPGHFDQPASFSGPVTTPDSAYFSLQGSIQGSIHRTNPDPSFGGQSLPRHLNEQPFHRTPQTPALDTRDQQFDGTLSITAVIHPPSGSTNKVTIPNNDTSIYPGYGIPDPKAFEGNSSQVDPAPSPMMPADSNAFSASAQQQPSTSQWNPSFSTPFTLDDRQPHSHYWNTDNYYQ